MQFKRVALSFVVAVCFAGYSFTARHQDSEQVVIKSNTSSQTATQSPAAAPTAPSQLAAGAYKAGNYTGSVADAFYGNIQVQVVISGGKITDVQFLQYPNDRDTSIQINQQAMPLLKQEALQAQSAQVDGVSGATDTSQAFIQSLSAALTKAQA